MKNVLAMNNGLSAFIVCIFIFASCSKSNDTALSSSDSQNVNSESVADSYTSETTDMTNSVTGNITNTQYGNGRVAGGVVLPGLANKDGRLTGATITITPTGTKDAPSGTITIDFGASPGITTNGVTRIGQIIVTYSGKKGVAGSSRVISYSGYSRNGVVFSDNMTFTLTNISDSTSFHHVLANGMLTFPDMSTMTRTADYNVTLDYTNKTLTLSASSAANSANGTTRGGKSYTMTITAPLVYSEACVASKVFIPVSGEKSITAGLLTYSINYGTGTCDNTIVITVGGKSVTLTASTNGN